MQPTAPSPVPAPEPPHRSGTSLLPAPLRRHASWLGAVVVGLALVGLLRGVTMSSVVAKHQQMGITPSASALTDAPNYSDLPVRSWSANAGWKGTLSDLKLNKPGWFDPVKRTEETKLAALADRARNRAFDLAPPMVPHPVDQMSVSNCLACHAEGLKVGDRIASRISHAHLSNCTQCHVEAAPPALPRLAPQPPPSDNEFLGLGRCGPGLRAIPGAPPAIPHPTWMREDCLACHGLVARPGLRTTHPYLSNCVQCHAPGASLDQSKFAQPPFPSTKTDLERPPQ